MKINRTTSLIVFGLIIIIGVILALTADQREGINLTVQEPVIENGQGDEQDTESAMLQSGTYTVDSDNSTITWTARKELIPNYIDRGTFAVENGELVIDENNTLSDGSVDVAVDSIMVTETGVGGGFNGLARDILSDRFIDAEQYPAANFVATSIQGQGSDYLLTGDLTIKGVTNEVIMPVTVNQVNPQTIQLDGQFEIDRTVYGIRFGSDKFFDNLGDKVIDDIVELDISTQATISE